MRLSLEGRDDLRPALIRAELARILASSSFRGALQPQRLLKYTVDAALAGQEKKLREFSLALDFFQRNPSSFDPRKDPVVRVAVGRVRDKLAHYYQNEGREAYLEIALPVGSYTPVFTRRSAVERLAVHRSVAVLPFDDLSGTRARSEAFAEELAAGLIDSLARVPGLKVIAPTSASRFRSSHEGSRDIGSALGVSALVRGHIERLNDHVRVAARLESTRDSALLWSGAFDEVTGDPFAIPNHIAQGVVTALRQSSSNDAAAVAPAVSFFAKSRTVNPSCKDLHDRGRFALRRQGVDGSRKAVELFEQAVAADPQFAAAYSSLALAHLRLVAMTAAPAASHVPAAKLAAQRALELDPQSSEACASLAVITFRHEFDWNASKPLYQMAIRLSPGACHVHQVYAFALMVNGCFAEADEHYCIARDLDPLDQTLRCQHALVPAYSSRYADAEAELLGVLDIDPDNLLAHMLLGAIYLYSEQPHIALREYEQTMQKAPNLSIGLCGKAQALALLGEREAALELLQEIMDRHSKQFVSAYQIAMVQTRLRDDVAALQWLDRAGRERDANFVCAPVDPTFTRLRPQSGWHALMKRYGLIAAPVPGARFAT
jgi:serine/threonine-protein kinase